MDGAIGLEVSWMTIFQVFMFSLSLSTGLEPDLAPLSPYTLVVDPVIELINFMAVNVQSTVNKMRAIWTSVL
jgi:hypothetical protein